MPQLARRRLREQKPLLRTVTHHLGVEHRQARRHLEQTLQLASRWWRLDRGDASLWLALPALKRQLLAARQKQYQLQQRCRVLVCRKEVGRGMVQQAAQCWCSLAHWRSTLQRKARLPSVAPMWKCCRSPCRWRCCCSKLPLGSQRSGQLLTLNRLQTAALAARFGS